MEREYSVNIGQYNTWSDWRLIPADRPVILPPTQKTHTIDIPGGNGSIDSSTALTRYPIFNNREGSWDFYLDNDNVFYSFIDTYTAIMNALQGKTFRISLEEDPEYFYDGKVWVTNWKQSNGHSMITLNYSVYPYKHRFKDVGRISTVNVDGDCFISAMEVSDFTQEPVCPKFVVKNTRIAHMQIHFKTTNLDYTVKLADGTWSDPMIMYIPGESVVLTAKGFGTLGIQAMGGWL